MESMYEPQRGMEGMQGVAKKCSWAVLGGLDGDMYMGEGAGWSRVGGRNVHGRQGYGWGHGNDSMMMNSHQFGFKQGAGRVLPKPGGWFYNMFIR